MSTDVACARTFGNRWVTFSFATLMHIIGGVSWVMPKQVVDLLACCNRGVGSKCWATVIWGAIPQCIMWTILWEHNLRTFNGKHSITELKRFFLLTLFDWMTALSNPYIPSFWEFLDLCSFTYCFVSVGTCPVYYRNSSYASLLLLKKFFYLSKKKMEPFILKMGKIRCLLSPVFRW